MALSVTELLAHHPIISDQIGKPALGVVLRELENVLNKPVAGDVVEFGCYIGTTSLFLRRVLDEHWQSDKRQLHVYDSFEGLPPKQSKDLSVSGEPFQAGALAVSKKQLLTAFKRAGLMPPIIHKSWFNQLQEGDIPNHIAYAFLDGDFYESILYSLRLVWPRLVEGGVITIDDYGREALPGVKRAVHDYFGGIPDHLHFEHNIGIIKK